MKSRVIKASQQVLSYGLDRSQEICLDEIVKTVNAEHKVISENSANEKIGYLCGFNGFNRSTTCGEVLNGKQCLIFSGIQRNNMSRLLAELRAEGISIPLKAMVTPTNQSWTLRELVEELEKEHEMMTKGK